MIASRFIPAALLVALFWMLTPELSAEPVRLTVDAAIQRALQVNSDLAADSKQLDIAQAALRRSAARFPSNPYLSLGASRRAETGGRPNVFVFLSQEVEVAGQRAARLRAAQHNLQQESWNLAQKRIALAADVKTAFTKVLSCDQRREVIREQLEVARKLRELATVERATLSERIDQNNAALQMARYERELWSTEEEREAELDALRRLLALDWSQEVELEGQLSADIRLLPAVNILVNQAKAQRADLQAFKEALAAADAQIEVYRRERVPNVTLSASYSRFDSSDFGGGDVGLSLPLFQTKEADIQEAVAQRQKIALQMEDLERSVERDVQQAYRAYISAAREVRLFTEQLLPLAEENVRLQERLLQRDEANRSEWLAQKLDALELRKDFAEALQKLHLAGAELERAVGGDLAGEQSHPGPSPGP
ncbi:MAG: TolC family protein [Candidatus Binatia bacterium]|nr:TolC family protein [Candidatus Binatia bacterium]